MTSKKKEQEKGPFERVVDAISDFMGQPLSDESYEVMKPKTVKKAKTVAKKAGAKGKKKRAPTRKKRASKTRKSKKA